MALDRNGNTIATGQVYLLAGTVRRVEDDQVWVVLGERGDSVVRVKAGDVVKVDDTGGPGGGVSDHGDLTGLADDDHTQYIRTNGTRAFTGAVEGVDPSTVQGLVTVNWYSTQQLAFLAGLPTALAGIWQPLDAQLTALAALSPSADQGIYWTSSTAAATFALTSFGRTLAGSADATAARSTLGVVIGTNVQAYDAELQALAGLVSAADRVPYFTGSGTAALATFTTFGRSLVDDADAAAARTTLGLGTLATSSASVPEIVSTEAGDPVREICVSSTAEATLWSGEIPAEFGATSRLELMLDGDLINNSGNNVTFTVRVKIGTTTMWADPATLGADADRRPLTMRLGLSSRGATNKQKLSGLLTLGDAGTADVGVGNFGASCPTTPVFGTATETLVDGLTWSVHVQVNTSSASVGVRLFDARLLLLP